MFYIYHMIAHTPGANIRINLGRSSWCNIDCIPVCDMVALASSTSEMVLVPMAVVGRGSELFSLNPRSPTRCPTLTNFVSRAISEETQSNTFGKRNKRTKNTNDNDTRTIYIVGLAIAGFSITRTHSSDY